ncbi:hypothetical protein JJB63_10590 [Clostridium perfringens]|uniref:Phage protein n=1 Tax=Clostridium perfringens F262 TaxID=883064 RepID=A0AAV3F9E4_CLOPF|nr:hypothetical protein [Clostridium perfringens]EIA16006.1 hypothetical protein HA1_13142 [Clostridium perfringens F262]ELC8367523.1 hypothetical protein [Clostridium perfringens]MBO3326062.1 hypothetical protein [Clostridium perfringens]MBO3345210.1 hypothetical protein [Clostridium perfringens]MBO3348299.1 hypothetical protein [Clostridium perfringens]
MRNTIDKITRDLNNIELRDTLDYVVMALLDTQNQIIKASGIMEVVKREEEAKAKIRELRMRKVSNE